LPKICDAGSIAKDGIGAIRVREDETFVQIAEPLSARFGAQVELDKGLVMERIEGEPDFDAPRSFPRPDRPARPERSDRSEKPAYTPKPPRVVEDAAVEAPAREHAPKPKAKYEDRPRAAAVEARPDWKDKREDRPRPAAKPYAERAPRPEGDADRKPRWSPDQKTAPRSTGFKSHGGAPDKPARATGYKSHSSEGTGYKGRADAARPKPEGYKPRTEAYKPREAGEGAARKPYAAKTEGYKPRTEGYKPRESGEGPARKPYAGKSEGYKPREDGDRPKKTFAPKGDDSRPFVKRDGPAKPGGFKKPYDKAAAPARPAKPKADAKDTSKRFVPPKGPKR
jgi:ATP-dependent RNA helicase DeaD